MEGVSDPYVALHAKSMSRAWLLSNSVGGILAAAGALSQKVAGFVCQYEVPGEVWEQQDRRLWLFYIIK